MLLRTNVRNNCNFSSNEELFAARLREFNDPDNYYLGVELETEPDHDHGDYDDGDGISYNIYATSDGSLSEYGCEFKNAPMTFTYMMRNRADEWDTVLNKSYIDVDQYCGMHIHISQSAFTNRRHVFKFVRFVYGNPNFTFWFSKRTENRFNTWAGIDPRFTPPTIRCDDVITRQTLQSGRENLVLNSSRSLSFTYNTRIDSSRPYESRTMEARLFNATMDPVQFYGNVEFMRALAEFTRPERRTNLSVEAFKKYVAERTEIYPNLHKMLVPYKSKSALEVVCA